MPLRKIRRPATKDKCRKVVSDNIRFLMEEGRPQKQAIAIALSVARKSGCRIPDTRKGRAGGASRVFIDAEIRTVGAETFATVTWLDTHGKRHSAQGPRQSLEMRALLTAAAEDGVRARHVVKPVARGVDHAFGASGGRTSGGRATESLPTHSCVDAACTKVRRIPGRASGRRDVPIPDTLEHPEKSKTMPKLGDTDFILVYGTTPAESRAFKLQPMAEQAAVELSAPSSFGGEVVVLERSADRLKVREIGRARGGRFFRKGRSLGWFVAGAAVGYFGAKAQQDPEKAKQFARSTRDRAKQGIDAVRARVGRAGGQGSPAPGKSAHEYGLRAAAEVIRKQGRDKYESNLKKLRSVARDKWDREYLAGYMQAGGFGPPPGRDAGARSSTWDSTTWQYAPTEVFADRRRQLVIESLYHPAGTHPKSPIDNAMGALELVTPSGARRWYGVDEAMINSELRMIVRGHDTRDEVRHRWQVVPKALRDGK